jgi:hypothetical protein
MRKMGSLDELRDLYKSSTKSKHLEIKTNGSTYSKVYKNEIYKRGNLVCKQVFGIDDGMSEIDDKYGIHSINLNYSLNKQGRWKMNKDLDDYMKDNNDKDVRVYETRDRIQSSYDNCVSFKRSKGANFKIKSTYANKKSIQKSLLLETQRERNAHEENNHEELKNVKNQKSKKTSCKKQNKFENDEHIIIDLNDKNDDDDDVRYTEYEFQLPPTMEVLKYNTLFDQKRKDKVFSRQTKNILGDEFDLKKMKELVNEYSNEANEFDEDLDQNEYAFPEKTIKVSLTELITQFTKPIVEKRIEFFNRKSKSKIDDKELQKIIYMSRQASRVDNKQQISEKAATVKPDTLKHSNISNSIGLKVQLSKNSLEKINFRDKFASRYYEALNAWPRMISISLNEDIIKEMNTNEDYDIKAWLTIKEIPNENSTCEGYDLILKTNLIENSLMNFNSSNEEFEFDDIYNKIIKFIANQPLKSFKLKEKIIKSSLQNGTPELMAELPNIAIQSVCKEIDDIKDELLNEEIGINRAENEDENNGSESSSLTIESNAQIVKEKLNDIFKTKTTSCPLCFEIISIKECIILKNCAHSVCNSCVTLYVDAFISNSNGGNLSCAVCDDSEIELAVLINFVSDVNKFEQYLTARINQILSIMCNYKWCSSPNCNKAIKVDLSSIPYGILSCECGHRTCLKCNEEPHFPAKCSQLAKYYSELKAKNKFLISKEKEVHSIVGKRV